jgi:beta-galactosidase
VGPESSAGDDKGDCEKSVGLPPEKSKETACRKQLAGKYFAGHILQGISVVKCHIIIHKGVYITMALEKVDLIKWRFNLGDDSGCLTEGRDVTVPHTWNIEEGTEEYCGTGWYGYDFVPKEEWKDKRICIYFGAVYHDAHVYLNGAEICAHENSGYTPFTAELTGHLLFGQTNSLVVSAANSYTDKMLPYKRSFDWANDGGMIRPARLLISGKQIISDVKVTAKPVLTSMGARQDEGCAVFAAEAVIDGAAKEREDIAVRWTLTGGKVLMEDEAALLEDGTALLENQTALPEDEAADDIADAKIIASGSEKCKNGKVKIEGRVLADIRYWHFDCPCLYTLKLEIEGEDVKEITFGFRDFHIQGRDFYLNGEAVRVCGTEWMPGSNPEYGSAEPKAQLEKMLQCLKEMNCVFTRFHWQQDDWVYDWCDRHGMLIQEEVPFWGHDPEKAGEQQWKIFREQIQEMVAAHRNHPSIIMWGVGNELDAQCDETIQYIKDAVAYTHRLDDSRPANYVANTVFEDPARDGTTDGDVMMINDYIGTWHGDRDQYGTWNEIVRKNPDKPMVPSEFGLCEPAFSGGDARRSEIFKAKMQCYRSYPNIAGTINFCLNDYRTQMGEDGEGKLRQRIHGSTDLYGNPKPSYYVVAKESSPLVMEIVGNDEAAGEEAAGKDAAKDAARKEAVEKDAAKNNLRFICRSDLPCYTVKGYYLQICAGADKTRIQIPTLLPGETWITELPEGIKEENICLCRMNGDKVLG